MTPGAVLFRELGVRWLDRLLSLFDFGVPLLDFSVPLLDGDILY